jgi:hypothetical protein
MLGIAHGLLTSLFIIISEHLVYFLWLFSSFLKNFVLSHIILA